MTPFPEQEPMAIRRIEVALRNRDWTLFKQGILKINSMHENGTIWSDTEGWQNLVNQAAAENIPPDLLEEFSLLTNGIIEYIDENQFTEHHNPPVEQQDYNPEQTYSFETTPCKQEENVVIFYNQDADHAQYLAAKKYKNTLNNILNNSEKYMPEPNWIEELSKLVSSFNVPNDDIANVISILSFYNKPGTIITSNCDNNIVNAMIKADINFSIPEVKQIHGTDNYWEFLPLNGLCCSYICSGCKNKLLKPEENSITVIGSCPKCSSAIYPDITNSNSEIGEFNPKVWWKALKKLSNASTWILVNPPAFNEKPLVKDLIKDSACNAKKVYIITQNFEISEWWTKGLSNLMPEAEIISNYSSLASLASKLNETYQRVQV